MDKKLVTISLEDDLVPLALETSKELMEVADNKTRAEVSRDILNRSSKYALKKDGTSAVTINIDQKVFTDALGTIGTMMGVKRTVVDITPKEEVTHMTMPEGSDKKLVSFEEVEG